MRGLYSNIIASSYQTAAPPAERIIQDGLYISYDPADNASYPGSGTTLYDLKGVANLTLFGGMESGWNSNGWFDMDGVNDYGQSASNVALNWTSNTNGYTVGMWLTWDSNTVVDFAFHVGSGTANGMIAYSVNNQRRLRWLMSSGYISYWNSAPANTWAYVVMTFQPVSGTQSNLRSYYGIGSTNILELDNQTQSVTYPDNPVSTIRLSHPSYEIDGKVGEYHIYERALTEAEINQNYNQTKARYGY
jgi:hypothetical protein